MLALVYLSMTNGSRHGDFERNRGTEREEILRCRETSPEQPPPPPPRCTLSDWSSRRGVRVTADYYVVTGSYGWKLNAVKYCRLFRCYRRLRGPGGDWNFRRGFVRIPLATTFGSSFRHRRSPTKNRLYLFCKFSGICNRSVSSIPNGYKNN